MTSLIKVPSKKAPPPIDVLARQIEALKNDSTPEKLKTVEPRLSRLDEKIKILQNSREGYVGELGEINAEFEKIRGELEIKLFFERFAVSEKVAKFLRNNPKKKPSKLNPAKFTTNPELQVPKVWKNILEDAKNGLVVAEKGLVILKKIEKDSSIDPKKKLEKTPEGKGILETAKKNPFLVGAFLLASGITIYKFLKKDSKMRDKVGGLLSGGVATYLGISLLKENFGSSMISFFGRKLLGEKWKRVEEFFSEKKKKKKSDQSPEDIEKYGEMVPLSDAIGHYRESAKKALRPITKLAKRNKDALTILTVAGLVNSETVRNFTLGGAKMTAESALALAKLPLKAVKGFPLTSLFAATGLLLGFARIKKGVGEFEVPKDPENMQKFLKAKINDAGESLSGLDIPAIPDAHIPIIADILTNKRSLDEFVAPAKEMLVGFAKVGFEKIKLTQKELIQKRNLIGLESFWDTIENVGEPENATALAAIKTLKMKVKNGESIMFTNIEKIKTAVAPFGFEIYAEDGRLKSVILDKNGVARIQSICVDSTLSAAEQFKVAQTFFVESNNWIEAAADSVGKTVDIPVEQIRLTLGNLYEDVKTETEVGEVIERKLKEGYVLATIGGALWLIAKGGAEKFILGPAEMIGNLLGLIPGGKDFSCVEMAIDYAGGLLPVAAFGMTGAIVRKEWARIFTGRVLVRSLIYPIETPLMIWKHTRIVRPLLDKNPRAIFMNPAIEFTSAFKESIHSQRATLTRLKGFVHAEAKAVSTLHSDISDLNRVKKLLARANGLPKKKQRKALIENVREILGDVEVKKKVFGAQNVNKVEESHSNIQGAIKKINGLIKKKKIEIKEIPKHFVKLKKVLKIKNASSRGKEIAKLLKERANNIARAKGITSTKAMREAGEEFIAVSRKAGASKKFIGNTLKYLGPAMIAGFGVLGAIDAATEDNEKIANLKWKQTAMNTGAGAAEMAAVAVAGLGAVSSALLSTASTPYLFMANGALDSAKEAKRKPLDWIQETSGDAGKLLHSIITTPDELSVGDTYRAFFTTATVESVSAEKIETRQKIWEALLDLEGVKPKEKSIRLKYIQNNLDGFYTNNVSLAKKIFRDSLIYFNNYEIYAKNEKLAKTSAQKDIQMLEAEIKNREIKMDNSLLAYALFEAAKILGYEGDGTLEGLKKFFNKTNRGEKGIYWDGKQWMLHEEGLEFDDEMGNGQEAAKNIIKRLKENATNIFSSRNKSIIDYTIIANKGKSQTTRILEKIAIKMANAMQEGIQKYQKLNH